MDETNNISNLSNDEFRLALIRLGLDISDYDKLSPEEQLAVREVLNETLTGSDSSYEELYYADYTEIPVDFETFISDDQYLGKSTRHGDFLYPFWKKEIPKIFASGANEVALSGSIGVGKSTASILMLAYHMYRTMCMRDPQSFFGLAPGTKIVYAFLNNTLASSESVGYGIMQSFLKESPWFLKHGHLAGRDEPYYVPDNGFAFVVGSRKQHTLGMAVCGALLDEVSFSQGQDANYTRSKIMDLYANIRGRMASRFTVQGRMYGMAILSSSKSVENAFLEAYIKDQQKKGYSIYVVDQPIWNIKPNAYSGKKFKIAVGNKFLPSHIIDNNLPEEEQQVIADSMEKQGLNVIDVPVELKQDFETDLDKALQDLAGISTATVTKAFSMQRIKKCESESLLNPFTMEVVSIGIHDDLQLKDFFDAKRIPDDMLGVPCFIHLDASVKGDRTGLSCVGIKGALVKDDDEEIERQELVYQQIFSIGIQAPSDSEISFEKTRQFIYYLRDEVGLNIKVVSTDGFQCLAGNTKVLTKEGYKNISVVTEDDIVYCHWSDVDEDVESTIEKTRWTRFDTKSIIVKTNNGEMNSTKDHKFLTSSGYCEAKDLKKYDLIVKGRGGLK